MILHFTFQCLPSHSQGRPTHRSVGFSVPCNLSQPICEFFVGVIYLHCLLSFKNFHWDFTRRHQCHLNQVGFTSSFAISMPVILSSCLTTQAGTPIAVAMLSKTRENEQACCVLHFRGKVVILPAPAVLIAGFRSHVSSLRASPRPVFLSHFFFMFVIFFLKVWAHFLKFL